ncbi:YopX family protein [Streptococcus pluranimalium]|uniref:YopX family protein n=1 Tax=Streptococcus pluranimalium TaxID=82348 RepID=UPI003F68F060
MIPKYRAWEISGKRMISVKSIDFVNRFIEYIHRPYSNPNRILSEILEFDQIHLMQSTGLKDKNGTAIFEGDVFYDEAVDEIGKVYYENGCFFGKTDFFDTLLYKIASDIKIIRNIYEHPDVVGED